MALIGSMGSGVSALRTFAKGLEVIGNNIANVNTTGFKSSEARFADSFSNVLQAAAPSQGATGSNLDAVAVGTGVRLAAIDSNFSQGSLSSTGKSTDLGISGNGFFRVKDTANNTDYATRAGDFRVDDQGFLVTQQGFRVQGLANGAISYAATVVGGALVYTPTNTAPTTVGDIKLDAAVSTAGGTITNGTGGAFTNAQLDAAAPTLRSITIDQTGNVVAFMSNGDSFTRGRVLLQNFQDPAALTKEGGNLFSGFDAAGPVGGNTLTAGNNGAGSNGLGRIQSGTLELSNVDLTDQFASLITTQRSFQAGSRLVTVSDTILDDIVNLKR